jgi:regulator of sigma E protease
MILIIIIFIAILTLVILVHELGHFFAARSVGIKVEEFGIGFPPRLFKIKRKGVIYSINAIPLGGFVKMLGEEEEIPKKNSFSQKTIGQRFMVLVAGVLANFVLAGLIFSICFSIGTPLIASTLGDHPYASKINSEVKIMSVKDGSPAQKAGLATGDRLLLINNQDFKNATDISNFTKKLAGQKVTVQIERNGQKFSKNITLDKNEAPLGIAPLVINYVAYPWYKAPYAAIWESGRIIKATVLALGGLLKSIFISRQVPTEVTGPVGIFILTREIIRLGWRFVLTFIAFLSLSIGIINILPFPSLDGGRVLFLAIEKIRHKRISPRIENIVHLVGFVLLISLIVLITYYDIMKF